MVPYSEFVENLKCEVVKRGDFSTRLSKTDSQLFDVYELNLDNPISMDEQIYLEHEKLKVRLKNTSPTSPQRPGNIFISAHYDLPFVTLSSKLMRTTDGSQKFIKYGEEDTYEEELSAGTAVTQISNTLKYSIPASFYSNSKSVLEAEFSLGSKYLSLLDETVSNQQF